MVRISRATYEEAGVPSQLLGLSFQRWTKADIVMILQHFGVPLSLNGHSKLELMRMLDEVVQRHNLNRKHRIELLRELRLRRCLKPNGSTHLEGSHRGGWTQRLEGGITHASNGIKPWNTTNILEAPTPNRSAPRNLVSKFEAILTQPQNRDCLVCMESLPLTGFSRDNVTSTCDHEIDVCLFCLSQHISAQFATKVWDQIDCPTCGQRLQFADIQKFAPGSVFQKRVKSFPSTPLILTYSYRYDKLALESCLSQVYFQRCRVPGCGSGQEVFPDDDNFMICLECDGRTCITCDTEWHSGWYNSEPSFLFQIIEIIGTCLGP